MVSWNARPPVVNYGTFHVVSGSVCVPEPPFSSPAQELPFTDVPRCTLVPTGEMRLRPSRWGFRSLAGLSCGDPTCSTGPAFEGRGGQWGLSMPFLGRGDPRWTVCRGPSLGRRASPQTPTGLPESDQRPCALAGRGLSLKFPFSGLVASLSCALPQTMPGSSQLSTEVTSRKWAQRGGFSVPDPTLLHPWVLMGRSTGVGG